VADTWVTLGNTAFNNQDWQEAIKAFSTAARLEPESVASWSNLAYALHAYGCKNRGVGRTSMWFEYF
jgi:cytochrome c-type biogenesis protein CcmH/NrfG